MLVNATSLELVLHVSSAASYSLFLLLSLLIGGKENKVSNFKHRPIHQQNGWLSGVNTQSCAEAQLLSPGTDHSREPQRVFISILYFV